MCINRLATDGDLIVADGRATGPHNLPPQRPEDTPVNDTNPPHLTSARQRGQSQLTKQSRASEKTRASEGGRGKAAMSMLSNALGSATAAFNCSGGWEREKDRAHKWAYTHTCTSTSPHRAQSLFPHRFGDRERIGPAALYGTFWKVGRPVSIRVSSGEYVDHHLSEWDGTAGHALSSAAAHQHHAASPAAATWRRTQHALSTAPMRGFKLAW